jgi:group I intron endonuclease
VGRRVISGIYKIENLINGKIYVGSAVDIELRKKQHFNHSLKSSKYQNPHLRNAMDKYGRENFDFYILEYVTNIIDILITEQYYIDWLEPEYNINPKSNSRLGSITSEITKQKQSETHKERLRNNPDAVHKLRKQLDDIRPRGEMPLEQKDKISKTKLGSKHTQETRRKMSQHSWSLGKTGFSSISGVKVYCIELNLVFGSALDAERQLGISNSSIIQCCRNKVASAGKHPESKCKLHWRYYKESIYE